MAGALILVAVLLVGLPALFLVAGAGVSALFGWALDADGENGPEAQSPQRD